MKDIISELSNPTRILLIIGISVGAHIAVLLIQRLSEKLMTLSHISSLSKTRTVLSLITSIIVFGLYFAAIGLILAELGVSLTAYLASASIVGLAIGFGSQGLVQDVVTGLTVIFSDLFDVGEMVEISGQSGIVKRVGMRFTVLINSFGAEIYIPNRTITNVINYPKGYVRCLADIVLPRDQELAGKIEKAIAESVKAAHEQFPGILVTEPTIEGRLMTSTGKEFLRVKFRIWPGRGGPIETTFRQEIIQKAKSIDPSFTEWMVTVNYEVEKKSPVLLPRREARKR